MESRKVTAFDTEPFFPRSSGSTFWLPLAELRGKPLDEVATIPFDLKRAEFHPNCEPRVTEEQLLNWRTDLNSWAYDKGFPSVMDTKQRSAWDMDLGVRLLNDTRNLPESLHPDVWCWIAVHLLPHFIVHRWGWPTDTKDGKPPTGIAKWSRFGREQKNGLRLAMRRVDTYGEDIARKADQEEFQFIENRPAFSLDRRVSRAILSTLIDAFENKQSPYGKTSKGSKGGRRIDANLVGIELRRINSMKPLCFASDDEVATIVTGVIDRLPDMRPKSDQLIDKDELAEFDDDAAQE
jgi:hypothetical protein